MAVFEKVMGNGGFHLKGIPQGNEMKGVVQEKVRHESFPNGLPMAVSSELMQHLGKILGIVECGLRNTDFNSKSKLTGYL